MANFDVKTIRSGLLRGLAKREGEHFIITDDHIALSQGLLPVANIHAAISGSSGDVAFSLTLLDDAVERQVQSVIDTWPIGNGLAVPLHELALGAQPAALRVEAGAPGLSEGQLDTAHQWILAARQYLHHPATLEAAGRWVAKDDYSAVVVAAYWRRLGVSTAAVTELVRIFRDRQRNPSVNFESAVAALGEIVPVS